MLQKIKEKGHYQAFFITLALAAVVFLPFIIYDKGIFFFYGDFNVQQIPFYKLAHEAIRSGDIAWNWYTDLGANFIGSYSFYLLFSPFFWLTLPFPTEAVPFLIGPLLMLKTACAALTSYFYIKRFVKDQYYAVIGSILYAFSGFAVYNIFFNHFHEVIVFFPLLLIGVEELVTNNRKGLFAITVAVNCLVNYWFFIGEVVFVVLYVFIRMADRDWGMTVKKFITLAFESVVGLMIAMFLLLPSVLAILGNPRTGTNNLLMGWWFWVFDNEQRLPAILQCFFFPPELPSSPNFFPDHGAKWSSTAAWLPMVSMTGVIAYLCSAKKSWIKRILLLSLFMAVIPGLNSAFILFNHSYYARWFYMPVLIMCVATVIALENRKINYTEGIKWTVGITAVFVIAVGFTPKKVKGELEFGLMRYPDRFWVYVLITAAGLLLTYLLIRMRDNPKFKKMLLISLSVMCIGYPITFIAMGKTRSDYTAWIRETALDGRYAIHLPEEPFARSDLYDSMDNLGMYWHLPNIQAFHSIIPASIMEFYPQVGVKRDVSSKPEVEYFPLRSLLSVRWFFVKNDEPDAEEIMPGFAYYDSVLDYDIYENENFLPMGFGYTQCYDNFLLGEGDNEVRSHMMMQAVQLDNLAISRNLDILKVVGEIPYGQFDYDGFTEAVEERRALSCYDFKIDNQGFTARSNLEEETLMFFSVPYDEGWSATVNGEEALIEKANIGFMAVRVPAGEAEIRFDYHTPGLKNGAIVSLCGLVILGCYLFINKKTKPAPASSAQIPLEEFLEEKDGNSEPKEFPDDKEE